MPSALKFSKSPTKRPGAPRLQKHAHPRTLVCLYFSCLFSVMQIVIYMPNFLVPMLTWANVSVNWEFVSWIVCALLRLLDERSRLQYRLKLTLQELEHLRSNEKRYESESAGMNNNSLSVSFCICLSLSHTTHSDCMLPCLADWLHTHSALLERVMRHGREGGR